MVDPHNILMAMTANLPMRPIDINGEPYLQRYFIGQNFEGVQLWLHRFIRGDGDRHLHTHPWKATAFVICGGYWEIRDSEHGMQKQRYRPGNVCVNHILPTTLHKIIETEPNTWTFMIVQPNWLDHWELVDDEGNCHLMPKSHGDHTYPWWQHYGPRGDNDLSTTKEEAAMTTNEQTSTKVVDIAARGLKSPASLTMEEIQAVCGSALAQAPDTEAATATELLDAAIAMIGRVKAL